MSNTIIIAGIAVGVAAMVGVMVYAHDNQQNYLQEGSELAPAAEQGVFTSELGMVELNKEQWHEDPYAEMSAQIRAQAGK
jgi:hypothetical protein